MKLIAQKEAEAIVKTGATEFRYNRDIRLTPGAKDVFSEAGVKVVFDAEVSAAESTPAPCAAAAATKSCPSRVELLSATNPSPARVPRESILNPRRGTTGTDVHFPDVQRASCVGSKASIRTFP